MGEQEDVIDLEEKAYFDHVRQTGLQLESEEEEEDVSDDLSKLPKEYFIKLLVLGDLGVGKTSLLEEYTNSDLATNTDILHQSASKTDYK